MEDFIIGMMYMVIVTWLIVTSVFFFMGTADQDITEGNPIVLENKVYRCTVEER